MVMAGNGSILQSDTTEFISHLKGACHFIVESRSIERNLKYFFIAQLTNICKWKVTRGTSGKLHLLILVNLVELT